MAFHPPTSSLANRRGGMLRLARCRQAVWVFLGEDGLHPSRQAPRAGPHPNLLRADDAQNPRVVPPGNGGVLFPFPTEAA